MTLVHPIRILCVALLLGTFGCSTVTGDDQKDSELPSGRKVASEAGEAARRSDADEMALYGTSISEDEPTEEPSVDRAADEVTADQAAEEAEAAPRVLVVQLGAKRQFRLEDQTTDRVKELETWLGEAYATGDVAHVLVEVAPEAAEDDRAQAAIIDAARRAGFSKITVEFGGNIADEPAGEGDQPSDDAGEPTDGGDDTAPNEAQPSDDGGDTGGN